MNQATTTLSILLVTALTCVAMETNAEAIACTADYAMIVDPVVTVTPDDCVTAQILGENWGGCSGSPLLRVVNGCEAELGVTVEGATETFLCLDSGDVQFVACDGLAAQQSGQVSLNPPVEGDVTVVEITLRDPDGSETLVRAEYGVMDTAPRPGEDDGGGCSTSSATGGSTGAALLLAALGLAASRRRRSERAA